MKHIEMFTGRIGRLEELHELSNGNCVLNFSVAETTRVKKNDEWVDGVTIWTDVAIFGDEARNLARSGVKPGTFVTVIGERRAREYTVKDTNEKRTAQSVVAEQVAVAITKFNFIEGVGSVNYAKEGRGVDTAPAKQAAKPAAKPAAEANPFDQDATPKAAVNQDPFADEPAFEDDPFADDDDPFGLNS